MLRDLGIEGFKPVLKQFKEKDRTVISYHHNGHRMFMVYAYFKDWDWIIFVDDAFH